MSKLKSYLEYPNNKRELEIFILKKKFNLINGACFKKYLK